MVNMANRSAPCSGLRSIIIPEGVLDSSRDNVIYIPTKLQNLTTPLYVKKTAKNVLTTQMLPTWNDELSSCGPSSSYFEAEERGCSAVDSLGNLNAYDTDEEETPTRGVDMHLIGNDQHNTCGMCDFDRGKRQILYMSTSGTEMKMPLRYAGSQQMRPPLRSWNVTVAAPAGIEPDVLAGLVRADNFPDPNADPMEEEMNYDDFAMDRKKTSSPSTKISYESRPSNFVDDPFGSYGSQHSEHRKSACFQPKEEGQGAPSGRPAHNATHVRERPLLNATHHRGPARNSTFVAKRPLNTTFVGGKESAKCSATMACGTGDLSGIAELDEDDGDPSCPGACDLVDDSYDDAYVTAQDVSFGTDDSFMSAQGSFSGSGMPYYSAEGPRSPYGGGGGGCGARCRR